MNDRLKLHVGDALEWLKSLPSGSADVVVTSPPYTTARTYGIDAARNSTEWVAWLRPIIVEAARVARIVCLNCADQVKKGKYQMGDIWLVADLTRLDGLALGPMPYVWYRSGIPGSGGKTYHRRDWEPVYVLARPENLPPIWSDNKAFGKPPKYAPGGEFSYRLSDGTRTNQWGSTPGGNRHRKKNGDRGKDQRPSHSFQRKKDAKREPQEYEPSERRSVQTALPMELPSQLVSRNRPEKNRGFGMTWPAWLKRLFEAEKPQERTFQETLNKMIEENSYKFRGVTILKFDHHYYVAEKIDGKNWELVERFASSFALVDYILGRSKN